MAILLKSLNEAKKEVLRDTPLMDTDKAIKTLVNIGFDSPSAYKQTVVKYARQMLNHACSITDWVSKDPDHKNVFRVKDRAHISASIDQVIATLQKDSEAKKIAETYAKYVKKLHDTAPEEE